MAQVKGRYTINPFGENPLPTGTEFMDQWPVFAKPPAGTEGTNTYRWIAQQAGLIPQDEIEVGSPKPDTPQGRSSYMPYLAAAGAAAGMAADIYGTANDYTENSFKSEAVKVPTSQEGLARLSRIDPLPRYDGYDFGETDYFKCGGKMGHRYDHGGYWTDVVGNALTGASAGSMIAPGIGTAIGAGIGLFGSIIGNEVRNSRARREADIYNQERQEQEANRAYALALGAGQINHDRLGQFARDYVYAEGGVVRSPMSGGNGVTEIKAGGSHERNPLGGVPIGVAPDGMPNLVEEGEVKWDKENYIFSNRLKPRKGILKDFVLSNKRYEGKSYAEIAKMIQKESEERENDLVARETVDDMLGRLMDAQELTRAEKAAKELQKMMSYMTPDEIAALAGGMPMQAPEGVQSMGYGMPTEGIGMQAPQMPQEAPMQQPMQQPIQGMPAMGAEAPMMAMGGHLYPDGGKPKAGTISFRNGAWGNESGSAWNGSTDSGWLEALAAAKSEGVNLTESDRKTVAQYMRNSKAYQQGTAWLKAGEENMRRYLNDVIASADTPAAAKKWARKFVNEDGTWKAGVAHSYNDIFNKREDDYPGTYWKTPQWILDEVNAPTPKEPVVETVPDPLTGIRYYIKDGKNYTLIGNPDEYNQWVLSHADYTSPYQFRTPTEDGVRYTDYFVEAPGAPAEKIPYPGYSPWPGIASAGIALAEAWNRPDYEKAMLLDTYRPEPVDYVPIGHYLAYDPMDIDYMTNVLRGQSAGTRAAINNRISPSVGAEQLAADYNAALALGNAYEQALQYNQKERQAVAEFNRGTDQFNAGAANQAEQTNFGLNGLNWERTKAYADARDAASSIASQANSAAVTSAMQNLNEAYKDWYNTQGLGWLVQNNVYPGVEYRKKKA